MERPSAASPVRCHDRLACFTKQRPTPSMENSGANPRNPLNISPNLRREMLVLKTRTTVLSEAWGGWLVVLMQ